MHGGIVSRQARIYIGTEAVYGVSMGIYGFVLNLFFLSLGMDTVSIGSLTSASIIIMGACALPLGFLARKTGRRNMYAGGVLMIGTGEVLYVLSPSDALFIPMIFVAVGMTMVEVSEVQVMYQSCSSDAERVTAYSVSFAVFALCAATGTFLAGHLPQYIGYRGTLLLSGGITLAVGTLRMTLLKDDRKIRKTEQGKAAVKAPLREVIDRRFLSFLAVIALHGALGNMIGPFANLILKYRLGWQDGRISALMSCSSVCIFIFALYTPKIQRRRMYRPGMYLTGYAVLIAISMGLAFCKSMAVFVLLFLLRAGAETVLKNMIDSATYLMLEDKQKDIYAGARSLTKGAVGALTALLTGFLLNRMQMGLVFTAAAGLMLCAGALFIFFIAPILGKEKEKEQTL